MPDEIKTEAQVVKDFAHSAIAVANNGMLAPASHEELWRQCAIWHKSGLCPESFKSPAQVFFAHQTLASLGVNPLSWLRNVAFIRNALSIFGDLPLALVNMNNKLACPPREFFIDENYEEICVSNRNIGRPVFAAVCQMWPKAQSDRMQERAFSIEDAKAAGKLPAKAPSPWASYTKRMLALKARGWLIKDLFPEVLNGVAQGEYDHDAMGESSAAGSASRNPRAPDAIDLNEAYAESHDEK